MRFSLKPNSLSTIKMPPKPTPKSNKSGKGSLKPEAPKPKSPTKGKVAAKPKTVTKVKEPLTVDMDKGQYKMLDDWQHLDRRPDMYVGPMTTPDEGLDLFVFCGGETPKKKPEEVKEEAKDEPMEVEGDDDGASVATAATSKSKRSVGKEKAARAAMGIKAVKLMCPLALLNIFEEITQNAIDKSIEDPTTKTIKVTLGKNEGGDLEISVWNDGEGIPCYVHDQAGVPVPTMLFGMTKSSDKYDDSKKRKSGGRNGIGAKATNFFSKSLKVETYSAAMGSLFKQTFFTTKNEKGERVLKWKPHKITTPKRKGGYTKVTYCPDLARFGLTSIPPHLIEVLRSKVMDIAACTKPSLSVYLDGKKLPLKGFSHYVSLFSSDASLRIPTDSIVAKDGSTVWNVGVLPIDPDGPPELKTGIDVGFVNGLRCCKGRHVEYARSKIAEAIAKKLKLKSFTSHRTRSYCHVFVTISLCNPSFDSQTKTTLESQLKEFGFKWEPSKTFVNALKDAGILTHVESRSKLEADAEILRKASASTKVTRSSILARSIVQIPKLRDASNAGKKGSSCTLILAEGDSAIGSVEPGLEEIGSADFGLFPLKGKPLNTRKAVTEKDGLKNVTENAEIHNVMLALGLRFGLTYETRKEYDTLRYKKVWLMMDQDTDGSHICGLVYSFLQQFFPLLLHKYHFVYRFATPLIRAVPSPAYARRLRRKEFFSHADFTVWLNGLDEETKTKYDIIYLKGLATSDQEDMRRYMSDYKSHIVRLRYTGDESRDALATFFVDENVNERKDILRAYDPTVAVEYDSPVIAIEDFLLNDMIHYSMESLYRGVACGIDGLKESQRKVLYTALSKNVRKRVKVAQFASEVAAYTHYHHGEKSVEETISKMAQEHPGSNNFNYLFPAGQFGSRSHPRKIHGQSRYVFTYLNPVTTALFPKEDNAVIRRRVDEEHLVEPLTYMPVVPAVLLNGCSGIGTGWSSDIQAYNPKEIFEVQSLYLAEKGSPSGRWKAKANAMLPWYSMHNGPMEAVRDKEGAVTGYISRGAFTLQAFPKYLEIYIRELPISTWTQPYLTKLKERHQFDSKSYPKFILDESNESTNVKVSIRLLCVKDYFVKKLGLKSEAEMDATFGEPVDGFRFPTLVKLFSMERKLSATNMNGFVRERNEAEDVDKLVLHHFSDLASFFSFHGQCRLPAYEERQAYILEAWSRELLKLKSQLRYLNEDMAATISIKKKPRAEAYAIFAEKDYPDDALVAPPPRPSDRDLVAVDDMKDEDEEGKGDEEEDEASGSGKGTFRYLLGLTHAFFTTERLAKLQAAIDALTAKMEAYAKRSPWDLWKDDLDNLAAKYEVFEKERVERATKAGGKKRSGQQARSKPKAPTKKRK